MKNDRDCCHEQGGGCRPQGFSAEELAQYDYWRSVNGIRQDFLAVGITLLTLGVFLFLCGHNGAIFWGWFLFTFVFSCIGYGLSFIGRFKVSRLSKIMVCVPIAGQWYHKS